MSAQKNNDKIYKKWQFWAILAGVVVVIVAAVVFGVNYSKRKAIETQQAEIQAQYDEISRKYHEHCDQYWNKNSCQKVLDRLFDEYTLEEIQNGQKENGDFSYFELKRFKVIEYCGHLNDKPDGNYDCSQFKDYSGGNSTTSNNSSSSTSSSSVSSSNNSTSSTDWRQWLKDYETWVDKYIATYQKYKNNPTDASLVSEYTKLAAEASEWAEKANDVKTDLSASDATEFANTYARILEKISKM